MSIKLLNLLVAQFGPATIGLKVRSWGFSSLIISHMFHLISLLKILHLWIFGNPYRLLGSG